VVKDRWGQPLIVHNCENVTQAASRDVLREGMFRAEDAGYTVILTVHDELVTETPDEARFSEADLSGRLAIVPDWAEGLPLAAEGYEATRYKKD
jgi:DNA polymerase